MKKISIYVCIFTLILSAFVLAFPNKKEVYALNCSGKAMCVLDANSGRVLYSKNMNQSLPMASTTKIVTAITVLDNYKNLDEYIEVDDKSIGVEGTSIYLRKGEIIKIEDLLYGLMLRSGNDAATALAIKVGGSIDGFAELMNNLAKKIGTTDSNFTNPHGLDDSNHYTSALDLAKITAYALNNPIFKKIVSSKTHIIPETNKSDKRYLTNKNKLLSTLKGCCGVKTGFTSKAGRCLVSAVEKDERTVVCVVLNCGPMFEESADLLEESFIEYQNVKIIDENKEIYNEYITDDNYKRLYLYTLESFVYPLKQGEIEDISIKYNVQLEDKNNNEEVGEIQIFLNKHLLKTLKLYTMNKIDKLIDNNTLSISEIQWEEKVDEN